MQLDRRAIGNALVRKGFIEDPSTHHCYYYHEYNGRRTGIYTYISHSPKYKVYAGPLLSGMKKQLGLDSPEQLEALVKCPMSQDAYNDLLKRKGLLREPAPAPLEKTNPPKGRKPPKKRRSR